MVLLLGHHLLMQQVRILTLVRELRSHMPRVQKEKTNNIVINSIKSFKKLFTSMKNLKKEILLHPTFFIISKVLIIILNVLKV